MTEFLILFPIAFSSVLHWLLAGIVFRWRAQRPVYCLFFSWLLIQAVWTSAHALYWFTREKIFSEFIGIVLPIAPATLVLFAMSYPDRKVPKWSYLVYVIAGLIWVPAQITGTADLVGKQFAIFQMPCMLVFDALAGVAWAYTYKHVPDRKKRAGALLLLVVNLPILFTAGLSYYMSYFIIQVPTYLPWFGDLLLSLSSLQTLVILRLSLEEIKTGHRSKFNARRK